MENRSDCYRSQPSTVVRFVSCDSLSSCTVRFHIPGTSSPGPPTAVLRSQEKGKPVQQILGSGHEQLPNVEKIN